MSEARCVLLDAANTDNPRDIQYCRPELTGSDIYQQTFVGNPRRFGLPGGLGRPGTRPVAPDDDPEFLRRIDEQRKRDEDPQ